MTEEIKTETEVSIPQQAENTQQPVVETEQEINWKRFRQQREEERKQKDAAEKYAKQKEEEAAALQNALNAIVNKPSAQIQYAEDESEDDRIEKKVQAAIKKREMEYDRQREERERIEYPQKLQNNFKDFNQVCTAENLDYLEYHYPEVVRGYKHMPDGYDKWEGIYMSVKKFIPNKNSLSESRKAESNLSKPQSMAKGGMTQTGDHAPIRSDESARAANWQRMQKLIKGI